MKIVGRILYAMVMVILFWFMFDYAKSSMTNQYVDKYANEALEQNPVDYDFFVSTVPGYRKDHVLFEAENDEYRLTFHEIVTFEITDDDLIINEFVYMVAHRLSGDFESGTKLQITTNQMIGGEAITFELTMAPFRQIREIYTPVYDDETIYIPKAFITNTNFVSVEIIDKDQNVLLTEELTPLNFEIRNQLISVYQTENELPEDVLNNLGILAFKEHTVDEFMDTFWIAMGVYAFILVFGTYFTFFFKKKYLGKQKPTEILKKHKERLKG